jgi:hypothetical protein
MLQKEKTSQTNETCIIAILVQRAFERMMKRKQETRINESDIVSCKNNDSEKNCPGKLKLLLHKLQLVVKNKQQKAVLFFRGYNVFLTQTVILTWIDSYKT